MKISKDIARYAKGSFFKGFFNFIFEPCLHAIMLYRVGNFLYYKLHFQLLPRLLQIYSRKHYGIDIDFRANIDEGLCIIHGNGVVIGCSVNAGRNLTLHQGVTLGGNSEKTRLLKNGITIEQPYIENYVSINTDATVLGPIIIGDNSVIGSRALVMADVPENSIVYSKNQMIIRAVNDDLSNSGE